MIGRGHKSDRLDAPCDWMQSRVGRTKTCKSITSKHSFSNSSVFTPVFRVNSLRFKPTSSTLKIHTFHQALESHSDTLSWELVTSLLERRRLWRRHLVKLRQELKQAEDQVSIYRWVPVCTSKGEVRKWRHWMTSPRILGLEVVFKVAS